MMGIIGCLLKFPIILMTPIIPIAPIKKSEKALHSQCFLNLALFRIKNAKKILSFAIICPKFFTFVK